MSHRCRLLYITGSHTTSFHITSSPPSIAFREGTGAERDEDPQLQAPSPFGGRSALQMGKVPLVLGGLHAWPTTCCPRNDSSREADDLGQATHEVLWGLSSADTWYLVIQLITALLLLRGKTETQERRRKWGTEGMWPYDGRAHRECPGLPLATRNQLVRWCLEKATASREKTAENRGEELGRHTFTLRDKELFLMFYKNPTSQQKPTNCQYSHATHRPESLLPYDSPSDVWVGQTYAHISTPSM